MHNSQVPEKAANSALAAFEPLIGRWTATITWSEALHKIVGGPRSVAGWAMFEWDRQFLLHSTGGDEQDSPFVHWTIGSDDASGAFAALYADSRGQSRIYQMSLSGDRWTMWRRANGNTQRFSAVIHPGGMRIDARWESSKDGTEWEEEFALRFTRGG